MTSMALDDIRIASPCHASWDDMTGDTRVRFCGSCRQNVYNLSEMTRVEAQTLLDNTEGRHCVRFYRRADGTMLTKDCGCGRQDAHRQMARLGTRFAMLFGLMAGAAALPRIIPPGALPSSPVAPSLAAPPSPIGATAAPAAPAPPIEAKTVDVSETPPPVAMMGDVAAPPVMNMGEVARPVPIHHLGRAVPLRSDPK